MERQVLLLDKESYGSYFEELIFENAYEQLGKEEVFLIGALEEGEPVGAAVWELETGRARLLSIAVTEEKRRKGIGTALLSQSMKILRQLHIDGVYTMTLPEETAAAGLLEAYGMKTESELSAHYRIKLEDMKNVSYLQSKKLHTEALKDLSDGQFYAFVNERFSMDTDLWKRELFEEECSRVVVKDYKIVAGIFVEQEEEELSVAWLHSDSNKIEDLLYLFQDAICIAMKKYSGDVLITFTCYSDTLSKIIQKMFKTKIESNAIRRWSMSGSEFRLAKSTVSAWERGEN